VILSNCYTSPEHAQCDKVHRRPDTHVIDYIEDTQTNIGGADTSGIDLGAGYAHGVNRHHFHHQLEITYLLGYHERNAIETLSGRGVYDLGAFPTVRGRLDTAWMRGGHEIGAAVRYVGSFDECEENDCNGGRARRSVDATVTADLRASTRARTGAGTTTIAFGVNNVLDQDPPLMFNGFYADSDASSYDFLGRYLYLRVTQAF
jgi:outer membrane receptor protein involved in Fe transport